MLIPKVEGFKILGSIFSSSLFPNRAPAGHLTLTSYVGGLIRGAINTAEQLVTGAEHLAEQGLRDLVSFVGGLIRDAEHLADVAVRDAEHLADTAVHDLANVTGGLIRDAEHLAADGITEAEHLASVGLHDLESVTAALIHDAEHAAEQLAHDLVDGVDSAWRAFVRDVFDPLKADADHWFGDVLKGADRALHVIEAAAGWLEWLITLPFDEAVSGVQELLSIAEQGPAHVIATAVEDARQLVLPHAGSLGR